MPTNFLPWLVRNATLSDRSAIAKEMIDELKRRIARTLSDEAGTLGDDHELLSAMVAVVANNSLEDPNDIVAHALEAAGSDAEGLIDTFAREALVASNFDHLFDIAERYSGWRADRDVLAALCSEGLAPAAQTQPKSKLPPRNLLFDSASRRRSTGADYGGANVSHLFMEADPPDPGKGWVIQATVYEVFFAALSEALSDGGVAGWSTMPRNAEKSWLGKALRAMEGLAEHIACEWKTSGHWPTVGEIYRHTDLKPPESNSHFEKRALSSFRFALRDVAIDLATIGKGLEANGLIDAREIESVVESAYWNDDVWLWGFAERRLSFELHSQAAAKILVERVNGQLDKSITSFSDRSTHVAQLALFAYDHGLAALAKKLLGRALNCVLGYGAYEDPFALEVLESLNLLAKRGDAKSGEALLSLAGEFEALTGSTDEEAASSPGTVLQGHLWVLPGKHS